MICGECGGRSYGGDDGPVGRGYSDVGRCTCNEQDSIDEFERSSGPIGGASPRGAQDRFNSRSLPQHQVKSFQVRRHSYPQRQAPSFQPRSTTSDTMPLALGIGIGVILGVVICLGFVIVF